ncbi:tetratricopeptide repeat protein, partial [Deinococcus pimensis]|uniref:tetratricopeptide repeat protein n=1 Tax=Deinococcus pimensis TaxID=309888 RepID=UPI00047FC2EE
MSDTDTPCPSPPGESAVSPDAVRAVLEVDDERALSLARALLGKRERARDHPGVVEALLLAGRAELNLGRPGDAYGTYGEALRGARALHD